MMALTENSLNFYFLNILFVFFFIPRKRPTNYIIAIRDHIIILYTYLHV